MNVVGKVGSLISQGVYSVATPFHPFGGAVDIIIVEQEDGTYRSTPWYVRFGKFQGVLKGAEKIVGISVNGTEAEFHMFLDNSGEAYFVREVEYGSNTVVEFNDISTDSILPGSSPGGSVNESNDGFIDNNGECNGNAENSGEPNGFENGDSPLEGSVGSSGFVPYHYGSLDEVEDMVESSHDSNSEMVLISVDGHVLTAPVSSNEESTENLQLSTPQFHLGPGDSAGDDFPNGDAWATGVFDNLDASLLSSKDTSDCPSGDLDASSPVARESNECPSAACEEANIPSDDNNDDESLGSMAEMIAPSEEVIPGLSRNETFMSCLEFSELTTEMDDLGSPIIASSSITNARHDSECSPENSPCSISGSDRIGHTNIRVLNGACDSQHLPVISSLGEHEGSSVENGPAECENNYNFSTSLTTDGRGPDVCSASSSSVSLLSDGFPSTEINPACVKQENIIAESVDIVPPVPMSTSTYIRSSSTEHEVEPTDSSLSEHIAENEHAVSEIFVSGSKRKMSNLGFELSLCGNLLHAGMGSDSANVSFETHRVSKETFEASWESIIKNENLILRFNGKYFKWDKAAPIVLGMAVFGAELSIELKDPLPVEEIAKKDIPGLSPSPSGRGWKLWPIPFRRVKSFKHTDSDASTAEAFVDSQSCSQDHEAEQVPPNSSADNQSPRKHFVRTNVPTTEQIASLKLKDGQNTVAFSFCTRVLGKQHVDAHIYLWKWNARIVISDVDGTITKSDVLGQFMPLVGKDWTQSGVAWLFSAIKENGYQLLFLSARAIVQAYLTRSFLRNLKQDGKTLPNGPIVISPDGLFPSLYREVIRRAPHEFKIACLEDIKALFPADYNPFYAGFGNRDTDELSYRKIGIPKGKIFIINPKGEVAINHCIDVKSYTSLHTLVNDMFPPTSLVEQEDFNSWNYWKMPLPSIDC